MTWINNLKIRSKLILGFLAVSLLAGVIGFLGINRLKELKVADENMYLKMTVPLNDLTDLAIAFQRIRVNVRDIVLATSNEDISLHENLIRDLANQFEISANKIEATILTQEGKQAIAGLKNSLKNYLANVHEVIKLLKSNDREGAIALMEGQMRNDNDICQKAIDDLQLSKVTLAGNTSIENIQLAGEATLFMIVLIVLTLIISISLGIFIAVNIQRIINSVVSETRKLVDAALNGDMKTRGNKENINFEFREIVIGINDMLDAVNTPLGVSANYIERISRGDLPPKITDKYNGDFNLIKNNLNTLIEALQLVTESTKQVASGNLNVEIMKRSEHDELLNALSEMIRVNALVVNDIQRIATGDLTVELKPRSDKDELLKALANMVEQLRGTVAQVNNTADYVTEGSLAISSSAQELSQSANEQASSVEEVSSSIEEMNSIIDQNTDNASQTEKISVKAATDINESNNAVDVTINAMKDIAQKIEIITKIAEKTDLLAINAAIEAARAGEHGEGFAVVASEVRKLAETSQEAAKEITKVAQSSVQIAERSGELLKRIVPDIQNTAKLVQEIAAASLEQSSGTKQINNAINQLNTIAQQNASAAEELSSSSEELTSQASQLKEVISFFKIPDSKQFRRSKFERTEKTERKAVPIKSINSGNGYKHPTISMIDDDHFENF